MDPLLQVRVIRRKQEAPDVCSFELVPADGGTLPPFTAGSPCVSRACSPLLVLDL